MPPFRNPFIRKPPPLNGVTPVQDENTRPNGLDKGSPRPDYAGSRTSSSLSIKKKEEPTEYKLSVVNDGVYLPPSPTERKSFWQRTSSSTTSSSHRSMLSDNEPFSISRESFDSYRRSFDISARSPVYPNESTTPRQSLDSRMTQPARSVLRGSSQSERPQLTEEEGFEDVGLADEVKPPPKRKSIFARFGDSSESPATSDNSRPSSSHRGFHLPGRKRGQSGQGAELGQINQPTVNGDQQVTSGDRSLVKGDRPVMNGETPAIRINEDEVDG